MHTTRNPTLNRYQNLMIHQKNLQTIKKVKQKQLEQMKIQNKYNLFATFKLAKLRSIFSQKPEV
jgi:hypothetical protein